MEEKESFLEKIDDEEDLCFLIGHYQSSLNEVQLRFSVGKKILINAVQLDPVCIEKDFLITSILRPPPRPRTSSSIIHTSSHHHLLVMKRQIQDM